MEEISTLLNSSLLRMRETSTDTTFVAVRNTSVVASKVASNAYEWRFILPPYILIFMLSISGNCLVIATLASNRRMRTITNVYLLNLAISDFLLGVFCLPFTLVGQIYRRFLFGALLCKLIPFLQAVSVSVDVWTLVAISLERYFAICRPLKSRKWQTQCHAYKMIAMVWILSIILNSPILIVSDLQPMRGNAFKCREVWTSLELERAFNLGIDAGLLLIPIFIMSFAYSLIVTKLWRGMRHEIQHNFKWQRHLTSCKSNHLIPATPIIKSNSAEICCKKWYTKKLQKDESEQRLDVDNTSAQSYCMHTVDMEFRHVVRSTHIDKSIEAKRKVIRMLFVIIMEFFVCWTPLHVINTIYLFYPDELYQYIGSKGVVLLQLLAYCSSCCNPITYCFMNRKFKQAFISLIKSFRIFGACFSEKSECKQATPPPVSSSQDATACVIRGSHTGRTGVQKRTYPNLSSRKKVLTVPEENNNNVLMINRWRNVKNEKNEKCLFVPKTVTSIINETSPSWMDWKVRIVFSSGSHSTALGSGVHPALPAPVVARPITQVIETGEEGSQFLYRITWARTGLSKSNGPTQPLYE